MIAEDAREPMSNSIPLVSKESTLCGVDGCWGREGVLLALGLDELDPDDDNDDEDEEEDEEDEEDAGGEEAMDPKDFGGLLVNELAGLIWAWLEAMFKGSEAKRDEEPARPFWRDLEVECNGWEDGNCWKTVGSKLRDSRILSITYSAMWMATLATAGNGSKHRRTIPSHKLIKWGWYVLDDAISASSLGSLKLRTVVTVDELDANDDDDDDDE
jgi:hypothetical protein